MTESDDPAEIARRLAALRLEHRDLDVAISGLSTLAGHDDLALKRLKRRKLQLKDAIARLESALIPDEPAEARSSRKPPEERRKSRPWMPA